MRHLVLVGLLALSLALSSFAYETSPPLPSLGALVAVAPGWQAEIVAPVDQSYAGWDVEIGDADNDGKNEILTTGCPDSQLFCFKKRDTGGWEKNLLAGNLAGPAPGMGLAVRVADLNADGRNEVVLGTGQEKGGEVARLYILETDGHIVTRMLGCRPDCNKSGFTHNLAFYDLDKDGVQEILSAYCGGGEVIRYDVDSAINRIEARKVHQLSGSGEESIITDVDNDGKVEYLTSNGFRAGKARVEIFEFDASGELAPEPRLTIAGFDNTPCFYTSFMVGDVDNDGRQELVVGWKQDQKINRSTVIAYNVGESIKSVCTFESETEDLDMGYFEKMMAIADVDNDGKNELVLSTRGDNRSEFITSRHLGHVFMYRIDGDGKPQRTMLGDFNEEYAESSWLAVGDADNDGKNEVVLATGKGDRILPGVSYVVLLKASPAGSPK